MNSLETGDILLFEHTPSYSSVFDILYSAFDWVIGRVSNSKYSHSAIVVKDPPFARHLKGLYVLESSCESFKDVENGQIKIGVELEKLEKVFNRYNGKIYYRKLKCVRNDEFNAALIRAHSVVHNRPYDMLPQDWIKAAIEGVHRKKTVVESKKEEIPKERSVKKEEIPKEKSDKKEEIPKEKSVKKEETLKKKSVKKEEPPKDKSVKKEESLKKKSVKKEEILKKNNDVEKDKKEETYVECKVKLGVKTTQRVKTFWCSALVAYLYTQWGFLKNDTPWTLIAPEQLGTEHEDGLKFQNCELEKEKLIKS